MLERLNALFARNKPVATAIEYLVVGLGNPGKEYEKTRHNAGYQAVDYIAKKQSVDIKRLRFRSLSGEGRVAGKRVLFLKPTTFMNNSGEAVRDAVNFYHIPMERVIVLCDDIALEPGIMRIRRKGSDGGQKGLKSIISLTNSDEFARIRIGVGEKPHPQMDLADWVLSKLTSVEEKELDAVYENCWRAVLLMVQDNIEEAMALFN